MNPLQKPEIQSIKDDAHSSEGKTPRQRMEMFADLMRTIDVIWHNLTPAERRRRLLIADQLNCRPEPWWKNIRPEAIEDNPCDSSSR